ncbi:MAG TPA: prolyl oligopeptidase family serine peptidase [Arachnia sp.]|nr:prolyl oligopeptidase family serine peptidase [Arachnia sp.]HMT85407.1 prolyl oligopeptidase family serine peptidase [Arachnia sp.]
MAELTDPHLWLEEIEAPEALAWVRARNAETEAEFAGTPEFARLEDDLAAIYDSTEKIPYLTRRGDWYYNFWRDGEHPRGLWRRTTLDEFRRDRPSWEILLDLDELNRAEGENWVWHGAEFLRPEHPRCLVALSRGGSDADVTREFDIEARAFVDGGFERPEAKGHLSWIDEDTVYLVTDLGPGSTNRAGYARLARRWRRGVPMAEAEVVFEGSEDNAGYGVYPHRDRTPGFERDLLVYFLDSRDTALYLADAEGVFRRVDAPDSAGKLVHREWLLLELREPWEVGETTYAAGSLLAAPLDDYLAGSRDLDVLFTPTDTAALSGIAPTLHHIVVTVLDDVKSVVTVLTPGEGGWESRPLVGIPALGTVEVGPVDDERSDQLWVIATDFLTPTTLLLADASAGGAGPEALKSEPAFFDATSHVTEQHFVTSDDGTRVPYFLVRPRDQRPTGDNPTLLYGYGGFEISLTPAYAPGVGHGWLERGGSYVVANIRGGGEYGPRWHQAALRERRHRAYEDFAAVARDLVARGITSPAHLGVRGGSNGGLLTGNMLTQYPELFGAVIIQVPLLDMRRYSHLLAGASWMAEYGDPDTDDWEFIRTFSPYHLLDPSKDYPPTLLLTSTRDDRVHPGHARKMMAKLRDAGSPAWYYENIEGGHGGAADNRQRAHMDALYLEFLWRRLA